MRERVAVVSRVCQVGAVVDGAGVGHLIGQRLPSVKEGPEAARGGPEVQSVRLASRT